MKNLYLVISVYLKYMFQTMEKSSVKKNKSELMELHIEFSDGTERVFEGFSPVSQTEWESSGAPEIKAMKIKPPYWKENKLFIDVMVLFSNKKKRSFFGLAPRQSEPEMKAADIQIKNIKMRRPFFIEDELRTSIAQSAQNDVSWDQEVHDPNPWGEEERPIRWDR